jgi:hypothetical protein
MLAVVIAPWFRLERRRCVHSRTTGGQTGIRREIRTRARTARRRRDDSSRQIGGPPRPAAGNTVGDESTAQGVEEECCCQTRHQSVGAERTNHKTRATPSDALRARERVTPGVTAARSGERHVVCRMTGCQRYLQPGGSVRKPVSRSPPSRMRFCRILNKAGTKTTWPARQLPKTNALCNRLSLFAEVLAHAARFAHPAPQAQIVGRQATIRNYPASRCSHETANVADRVYGTCRFAGPFRADDGTRTHDLLHGNKTQASC